METYVISEKLVLASGLPFNAEAAEATAVTEKELAQIAWERRRPGATLPRPTVVLEILEILVDRYKAELEKRGYSTDTQSLPDKN